MQEEARFSDIPMDRRGFLRVGRDLAFLGLFPGQALAEWLRETERDTGAGLFLDRDAMRTLRALCAQFVPGPPEDPDPGAVEAGVPEHIDLLLAAFEVKPAHIFAGGPFSDRHSSHNYFARFLELDALQELAWRTRIEGSRGLPEREWNGPVVGLQQRYSTGLGLLGEAARRWGRAPFAKLPHWRARWLLRLAGGELEEFLDLAFGHCIEGMYGPPEYGGNRDQVGWAYAHWPGDHQPRPYTVEQITQPDPEEAKAVERGRRNAADYLDQELDQELGKKLDGPRR
ncbi:MAG: gluconate 2-dehydrogenase subunit 3 family protein [Deltaproteobacteria bacterium]|nr:gluconate 2-dehydrogenase subunit 3 family protein [Deltaproteobacteria bacterium]MBW2419856.1 gluconate 2-dehydrogenase subunit 3 family protein [Deltaproteobacteria bacterium]